MAKLIWWEYQTKLWMWNEFGWWQIAFLPLVVLAYIGFMAAIAKCHK